VLVRVRDSQFTVRLPRLIGVEELGLGASGRSSAHRSGGFDNHLTKPIDPASLSELLAHFLLANRASHRR
jgi:hypothetical protein